MVVSAKNTQGFIYAYAEFQILNSNGQFEDNGEYLYIQDIWIHDCWRKTGALRRLIRLIDDHDFTRNCKYVYWVREKYNDRQTKIFPRQRLVKMGV